MVRFHSWPSRWQNFWNFLARQREIMLLSQQIIYSMSKCMLKNRSGNNVPKQNIISEQVTGYGTHILLWAVWMNKASAIILWYSKREHRQVKARKNIEIPSEGHWFRISDYCNLKCFPKDQHRKSLLSHLYSNQ